MAKGQQRSNKEKEEAQAEEGRAAADIVGGRSKVRRQRKEGLRQFTARSCRWPSLGEERLRLAVLVWLLLLFGSAQAGEP